MKQYLAITNEVFNYNKTLSPKLVINKTNYHFTLISFLYFSLTSNITSDKHLNGWQVYSLIPTQFHTEKKHFMATTCISTGNRQTRKRVRTHHHKLAHIPSPRICATECSIFLLTHHRKVNILCPSRGRLRHIHENDWGTGRSEHKRD